MITVLLIFIFNFFFNTFLGATSLSGTSYQAKNYLLRDTNTVTGLVRFANGFTILPSTNHGAAATLDTCSSCSGGFDLQGTSTLILLGDLKLDSVTTITSSGKIYGYNRALVLGGDLTLAANQVLHLDGNLVIDGMGHDIFLNEYSQLMLDANATVTIQNTTIHNKRNNPGWPSIALTTTHSRLTLSDVELALDSDFYVNSGQLFIHNDVAVTGTSALIWHSIGPCTIEHNSCLYFDVGTTFSYAPPTTDRNLIRMANQSSTLHLNGCSLLATHTGLRLTKGTVLFDNKIILDSAATNTLNNVTSLLTKSYGDTIFTVAWSPNGKYLAVGGYNPALFGGSANTNELQIYSFNGSTLTAITSQEYGYEILTLAWSSDGRYLAIGGKTPGTFGIDASTDELQVYEFNGSSLTPITSQNYGTEAETYIFALAWSPDGKYLAIGGHGAEKFGGQDNTNELQIYQFNGKALTTVTSQDFGTEAASEVRTLSWSPDGTYLAVGGFIPTLFGGAANTNEIQIYRFNNGSLTPVTSQNYGNSDSYVFSASWSPDGHFLALGGTLPTTFGGVENFSELQIYEFSGNSLSPITSKDICANGAEAIWSLCWSPDGRHIVIGGSFSSRLKVYKLENNTLTLANSQNYTNCVFAVAWAPNNNYLAVGGINGDNDLTVYTCNYLNETATQATTNGVILGNNAQGSDNDVSLQLLGNAHVNVNGIFNFDNNSTQPTFVNRDACFVLQDSSAKISLTPASVLGWKDGSIIKEASGVGEGDYNLQGYTGADSNVAYSEAPMSLVYSTSLALVNAVGNIVRSPLLRDPASVMVYTEHENYAVNTTISAMSLYKEGFTVANGIILALNVTLPISGNINLSGSGTLALAGDLIFSSSAYLTSGGIIDGNGNTLSLTSSLVLPANKRLKITDNLAINGQNNNFVIEQGAKITIDANVSVTLRNINWFNANSAPFLEMLADSSRLTLDNVSFNFDRDFSFTQGRLFIYNDVDVTGTTKFSYASTKPMYIKHFSNLIFDQGTTFSYSPHPDRPHTASERELLRLEDCTARLFFNNCTIALPDYGMQLTKGTVLFDNKVTINGNTNAPDQAHSFELGDGNNADNDIIVKVLSGAWVDVNGYLYHNPA